MNKNFKFILVIIIIILILYVGICLYLAEKDIKNSPQNNMTSCQILKTSCNNFSFNISDFNLSTITIINEVRTIINKNIGNINNINIT